MKGHTLENKWLIYDEVKKCGFKHIVVCAFTGTTRVDDYFTKEIQENTNDLKDYKLYGFAEVNNGLKDRKMIIDDYPTSLKKMKSRGINNPIFEIDLNDKGVDWNGAFTIEDAFERVCQLIKYTRDEMDRNGNIFVNIRDFSIAMDDNP